MSLDDMHKDAAAEVRALSRTAGISYRKLSAIVDTCNTDGAGNSYRITVAGYYRGPASSSASQSLVDGWATKLRADGWTPGGAPTESQTILDRREARLILTSNDPMSAPPVPPNFQYVGPCQTLSGDDRAAANNPERAVTDILDQVR